MINNEIYNICFSFITAFVITFFSIPTIIKVAKIKHLFDFPNPRKIHLTNIPTLGGIGIFLGFISAMTFWTKFHDCWYLQYVIASLIVISIIGIKDDVIGLSPFKKATGQILAALIVVIFGDLRIDNFYNIFGIQEIPYIVSILFTAFTIIVIINAYNLIDGIDGLAACLGIIASVSFGTLFFITGINYQQSILAFSLAGAILGFLRYNLTPARIFMGDTGSMVIGFILAFLAIEFLKLRNVVNLHIIWRYSGPLIAMSFIFLPLYDLVRVFSIRLWHKRSPFKPDQNHLHHMLLKLGASHLYSTLILSLFACLLIALTLFFQRMGNYWLGLILLSACLLFTYILYALIQKNGAKSINGK
ncbi:MAG: undecaprenyl-phosphate alpha-N-acetylglucosaminyl 1-phosphate transferase [Bacteroidetes bacterium CG23_combo_of_CG06-09_8_20_14_all_32_9]|nr:MAG: undecaprenyl-phosphate alpha-N-acetylglucosaminyl 1-phosphate transferase [Bacteroidetes bacterium CG23_combo_of_CG06-09_8_20_14_all_32_9]